MSIYEQVIEATVDDIIDIILDDLYFNGFIERADKYRLHDALSFSSLSQVYDCLAEIEEIAEAQGDETGYEEGYQEGYREGYEDAKKNKA